MKRELVSKANKPCRRCGSNDVAWHQSERGKWYLIEVFIDGNGYEIGHYRDFHSTYCGKPELHNEVQGKLTLEYQEEQTEFQRKMQQREEERIAQEAEWLNAFSALSPDDQRKVLDYLRSKLEKHTENYVSMDYFVEHSRWCAESEAMKAEISMLEDYWEDENV